MSPAALLQTASLVTVAVTIALSAMQNRHVAAQTREVAHQSTLAHNALERAAHQNVVVPGSGFFPALMTDEPELLSWFLATRGLPVGSADLNKRHMLMFLRMDTHEAMYLAHLDTSLPEDVWSGWVIVLKLDAATAEFQTVWKIVSDTFSTRFARFVDSILEPPTALPLPLPAQMPAREPALSVAPRSAEAALREAPGLAVNGDQKIPEDVVER